MHTPDVPQVVVTCLAGISIIIIALIFIFVFFQAMPTIRTSGFGLITAAGFDTQISDAFYRRPDDPLVMFGMLGLIMGTLLTTGLALVCATVLGLGASITIVEFCGERTAFVFTNIVRLLAAIPSVVYGLIGIIVIVPVIENVFITVDMQIEYLEYFQMTGRNVLAGVTVLTFMIVPTIVSLSIDAISAVPNRLRETGYAFGMSRFRVIWKIVLPAGRNGIIAGILLGAGRGIGEAIAISMVCGGVGILPKLSLGMVNLLAPTLPLAAAIINKSEAIGAEQVASALFTCGALLLMFGAVLSITARVISGKLIEKGA